MPPIESFRKSLESDLNKQIVNTNALCGSMILLTEQSRKTTPYLDPRYIPFYYHLGKYIDPTSMVESGVRLGLFGATFLKSCKTIRHYLGFQQYDPNEFYSLRFAKRNIGDNLKDEPDFVVGDLLSEGFQSRLSVRTWDLIIINEELSYDKYRIKFDTYWNNLSIGGLIVCDYVKSQNNTKTAFKDFCTTKNRDPIIFETRYGVGVVQR